MKRYVVMERNNNSIISIVKVNVGNNYVEKLFDDVLKANELLHICKSARKDSFFKVVELDINLMGVIQ